LTGKRAAACAIGRQAPAALLRAGFPFPGKAGQAPDPSAGRCGRGKVQIPEDHRFSNLSSLSMSLLFRVWPRVSVPARPRSS